MQRESLEAHRKLVRYFAASNRSGKATLTVFDVGERNIMSSLTSLSPDPRLVKDHAHIINKSFEVAVTMETLTTILEKTTQGTSFEGVTEIDFISIDTEGTELDVLEGFDFERFPTKLFVIENNYDDPHIKRFMSVKGYVKVKRYKVNDFYLRR